MSKHCLACGRSRLDRTAAAKLTVLGAGATLGFVLLCEGINIFCIKMGDRERRKREAESA